MIFLPVAFLLAQAALLMSADNQLAGHKILASICAGKKAALTRSSELFAIVAHIKEDKGGDECREDLKRAIIELSEIISFGHENVCSLDKVSMVKRFYEQYLDKSSKTWSKRSSLPKCLKKFFLSYGMQVSNLCKKNMVKVLREKSNSLLRQDDFDRLGQWSTEKSPAGQLLNDIIKPDEIVLPVDLTALLKPKESMDEKIYLQSGVTEEIEKLKNVCLRRFRPIYKHLILPLTQLASIGFDYMDPVLKKDLQDVDIITKVGLWSRIVFLCEALMLVEPVEELPDEDNNQTDLKTVSKAKGKNLVRLLTRDEAEAIKKKLGGRSRTSDLELLVYRPIFLAKLDDLVVDDSNHELKSAVSSFSTSKSTIKRAKKKMLRRGIILMREHLKHDRVGVVASSAFKDTVKRLKHNNNTRGEMDEINSVINKNLKDLTMRAYDEDPMSPHEVVLAFLITLLGSGMVASCFVTVAKVALGLITVVAGLAG